MHNPMTSHTTSTSTSSSASSSSPETKTNPMTDASATAVVTSPKPKTPSTVQKWRHRRGSTSPYPYSKQKDSATGVVKALHSSFDDATTLYSSSFSSSSSLSLEEDITKVVFSQDKHASSKLKTKVAASLMATPKRKRAQDRSDLLLVPQDQLLPCSATTAVVTTTSTGKHLKLSGYTTEPQEEEEEPLQEEANTDSTATVSESSGTFPPTPHPHRNGVTQKTPLRFCPHTNKLRKTKGAAPTVLTPTRPPRSLGTNPGWTPAPPATAGSVLFSLPKTKAVPAPLPEDDKSNSSSPPTTPTFRFTSFPASLPRVEKPRSMSPIPPPLPFSTQTKQGGTPKSTALQRWNMCTAPQTQPTDQAEEKTPSASDAIRQKMMFSSSGNARRNPPEFKDRNDIATPCLTRRRIRRRSTPHSSFSPAPSLFGGKHATQEDEGVEQSKQDDDTEEMHVGNDASFSSLSEEGRENSTTVEQKKGDAIPTREIVPPGTTRKKQREEVNNNTTTTPGTAETIVAVGGATASTFYDNPISSTSSTLPKWFSPCGSGTDMAIMEDNHIHLPQDPHQRQYLLPSADLKEDEGRTIHARLFEDEYEEEEDNCATKNSSGTTNRKETEEEEDLGLMGRNEVICTRLNFNSLLSPVPPSSSMQKQGKKILGDDDECPFASLDGKLNYGDATSDAVRRERGDNLHHGESTPIFQHSSSLMHNTSQDVTQPYYDRDRTYSLESTVSTHPNTPHTPFRNVSRTYGDVDDTVTTTPANGAMFGTPSFHVGSTDTTVIRHRRNHLDHHHQATPREVHLQFHLDSSQCSPIEGPPDDEGGGNGDIDILRNSPHGSSSELVIETSEDHHCRDELLQPRLDSSSHSSPSSKSKSWRLPPSRFSNASGDDMMFHGETESCGLSSSNVSGSSSTTNGKTRKNRPMPDMSAFDGGATPRNKSSSKAQEQFGDDGDDNFATSASGAAALSSSVPQHLSPKLLCPPTPVRTPAWAHNESLLFFGRSDSLITTKVLAACPPQVLDGLSSLENSLLEDDNSGSNDDYGKPHGSFRTFSAVEEGSENESPGEGEISFSPRSMSLYPRRGSGDDSVRSGNGSFDYSSASTRERTFSSATQNGADDLRSSGHQTEQKSGRSGEVGSVISFDADFENLGLLGRGAFADVYKAQSKADNCLYAIKRNRRQFRGKRDRDRAMAEVQTMQRLQSACAPNNHGNAASNNNGKGRNSYGLFLLFFIRAWQEDGYFFCQTELCCRESCLQMIVSLSSQWNTAKRKYPSLLRNLPSHWTNPTVDDDPGGRLVPEPTVWKLCHDISAGLSHIHSHGMVHYDIKPTNIYFHLHNRLGTMCKIGDFGLAGDAGVVEDGQEGDTKYMAQELLSSSVKHPSADMFSLGLTLYEIALTGTWELPTEGPRWHELRSGSHTLRLAPTRSQDLSNLIQRLISPEREKRPSADDILDNIRQVRQAGTMNDKFLTDYVRDVEEFDLRQERRLVSNQRDGYQRRSTPTGPLLSRNSRGLESEALYDVRTPTPDSSTKFFGV
uniref:Protein kinase domain-containing protein n=3 Tax=Ditylum brightwellii TaxID=49249 RepID=A0A7S4RDK5_9STRA